MQANLAARSIQFHAAGFQHTGGRGLRRGCAPELQLDARDQLTHEEGLHHVVVGAQFQAHNAVRLRGSRRQKDDRGGGQFGILSDAFADIQAVGVRQHDIQQDEVGPHLPAQVQGPLSGLQSGQRKALLLEVVLQQREEVGVIFD